jgi:hypothetical protein
MRLTGQLKTKEINRFRNQTDFRKFKEHFEPTLSPVNEALDRFKMLDNTEADGNKEKGQVALAPSSGYKGFLSTAGGARQGRPGKSVRAKSSKTRRPD